MSNLQNFDLSAAEWRKNASDDNALVEGLASRLQHALPGITKIERAFRLFSKKKPVTRIQITFKKTDYILTYNKSTGIQTSIGSLSGGIKLSTKETSFNHWLKQLSDEIARYAQEHSEARETLENFLFS